MFLCMFIHLSYTDLHRYSAATPIVGVPTIYFHLDGLRSSLQLVQSSSDCLPINCALTEEIYWRV